jgi:hypothetical protein
LTPQSAKPSTISNPSKQGLIFLSFGRLLLFAGFQALLTLIFWIAGRQTPAADAAAWWLVQVILTNLTCVGLLAFLMKREGKQLVDLYRVEKHPFWRDLLLALGLFAIGLPIGALPNTIVAQWLFGDALTPAYMMFRPIPTWALVMGLLFPLTIAFAEIPFYFAYIMPRLQAASHSKWTVTIFCALALAAQHITLPLILDGRFILWRLLMYLPFALYIGVVMQWKPRLLNYFMVFHALMDLSALAVYFSLK